MSITDIDAFRAEITSLRDILGNYSKKTVREISFQERIRNLFRTWTAVVEPTILPLVETNKEILKSRAELEALAKLSTKISKVDEYKKRLHRVNTLLNSIIIYLPPTGESIERIRPGKREERRAIHARAHSGCGGASLRPPGIRWRDGSRHRRRRPGERGGSGLAYPGRRTGDDDDLVLEI